MNFPSSPTPPSNERWEVLNPASGCAKCPALWQQRQTVVWGSGPAQADIMGIGEAPGYNEDKDGLPFVGAAGRNLNRLLTLAGISRDRVHIANRLMCRPPGNRDPEPSELDNCEPWLVQHMREVNPLGVMLFGRAALGWKFQKQTVAETIGLMYRRECDACGQLITANDEGHLPRFAKDGLWVPQAWCDQRNGNVKLRVYVSIYHPAAQFYGEDHSPDIVRELRRLAEEVEWLKQEAKLPF